MLCIISLTAMKTLFRLGPSRRTDCYIP